MGLKNKNVGWWSVRHYGFEAYEHLGIYEDNFLGRSDIYEDGADHTDWPDHVMLRIFDDVWYYNNVRPPSDVTWFINPSS